MNYRSIFIATIQTAGMFVAGFVIPVLGQVIALFTPAPLVILSIRSGMQQGFTALFAACLIVGILAGWQTAAILLFSFGLMSAGISEGMRRQWKPESAILLGGLLPAAVLAIIMAYHFSSIHKNPVVVIEEYLRGSMSEAITLYTQLGLTEMAEVIRQVPDRFIYNLVRLIPGIIIATSVFQAACCYGLSRMIILRRPERAPSLAMTPFAQWHAPDAWIWGLIAGLVLILIPGETARFSGWNILILYTIVYLTQGAAVVEHYLRKGRIQPFLRGLIHLLVLALPSIVFVIALGVVDIWADFRKVRVQVRKPENT
jgi:uncharacterized protein YybS (DUF2232 family)